MNPYDPTSPLVEFYDEVYEPMARGDVGFYVDLARRTGGPVLELGCGTGRILLPTLRAGCAAVGLDASERMLARCAERLSEEPEEVRARARLVRGDVTNFELGERFALVTAPFRVFQHLVTVEEQLAALACVRRHLAPGGRFVFDVFNPDLGRILDPAAQVERDEFPDRALPDGRRFRRASRIAARHLARQVSDVEIVSYAADAAGTVERKAVTFPMRWYHRYELEHLVARAGLEPVAVYGDWDRTAVEDASRELIVVAKEPLPAEPAPPPKRAARAAKGASGAAWTTGGPRVIAVDWSGAADAREQRKTIWVAEAQGGKLCHLEGGRDRTEVVELLVREGRRDPALVVGLDFAFSFPAWFLAERGCATVRELWALVEREGVAWLVASDPPFWGRPGKGKPTLPKYFRATEARVHETTGVMPKSVFQIAGAGTVGAGSLRGMPLLARLQDEGFTVWPFDPPGDGPRVVEIYPRLLTGDVTKSRLGERIAYLQERFPQLDPSQAKLAAESDDAFDAAVSALVMSAHYDALRALEAEEGVEGRIWMP